MLFCGTSSFGAPSQHELSEEQKRMYAAEKLDNFRYLSRTLATRSPYVLTRADAVSSDIVEGLSLIGALL